ncbi:hypothetical protein DFH28DRAFT_952437 [Melampsora americana]|nr:hypothetical protein DFH28DRAFT_952437 [Melampsora americana]
MYRNFKSLTFILTILLTICNGSPINQLDDLEKRQVPSIISDKSTLVSIFPILYCFSLSSFTLSSHVFKKI